MKLPAKYWSQQQKTASSWISLWFELSSTKSKETAEQAGFY